jgi:ribosomal protein L32
MQAVHSAYGHCVVCGVRGRGQRDFICQNCGDHSRTNIVCGRCGEKNVATPRAIKLLGTYSELDIPKVPGVVIKLSCCIECHRLGEVISVTVFTLRPRSN